MATTIFRKFIISFCALALCSCAPAVYVLNLDPNPAVNQSIVGQYHEVKIVVTDTRDNPSLIGKSVGRKNISLIKIAQDPEVLLKFEISEGMQLKDFRVRDNARMALEVSIISLRHHAERGIFVTKVDSNVALEVRIRENTAAGGHVLFRKTYRDKRSNSIATIRATNGYHQVQVNNMLSDIIGHIINDETLILMLSVKDGQRLKSSAH